DDGRKRHPIDNDGYGGQQRDNCYLQPVILDGCGAGNGKEDNGHHPDQHDVKNQEEIPVGIRVFTTVYHGYKVNNEHYQYEWAKYAGDDRRNFPDQLWIGLNQVGGNQGYCGRTGNSNILDVNFFDV